MTATWRDYSGGVIERGTEVDEYGSRTTPIKVVTLTGDQIQADELISIPAGTLVTLWAYSASDPDFAFMRLVIVGGSGFLDVYWKGDKPTSASNKAPLGTHECWNQAGLSCDSDFKLCSQQILVHDTLATAAGDNAGFPAISYSGSGFEQGFIYKLVVKNRGTDAVPIRFTKLD